MKKNYYIVGAGLLLLYLFLKSKKGKQPAEKVATDATSGAAQNIATFESSEPLLISPSIQQDINEGTIDNNRFNRFNQGINDNGQNITVRYIAGNKKHYI